jgi:acetyl/propionyl-CoA carboxylase alpha subunit
MTKATIDIAGTIFEFDETDGTIISSDRTDAFVDIRKLSDGEFSVIIDGSSFHVYLTRINGFPVAVVNNHSIEITLERLRDRLLHTLQRESEIHSTKITHVAPMPGLVTQVLKTAGTYVESGTGIVIIEAMKMENEITAKKSGTIITLNVIEKQTVEKNDQLFTIESV